MPRSRSFGLVGLLTLGLFLSCTDGSSPTGSHEQAARLAVVTAFPASAASADAEPIVNIRVTVSIVPSGVVILQDDFSVDPNASEWALDLEIPLDDDPRARYLLEFELINASGQVEWSARLGPLALVSGQPNEVREVGVSRGPLENLSVTGLSLSGPSSVLEGDDFSIGAEVTTSDGSVPTVFWTSLTPDVVGIDDSGNGVALAPGTALIQADAGPVSADFTIEVIGVPAGVVISPPSATLSDLGETVAFTADVVDSRGVPVGDPVSFSAADDRVLGDLGGGTFVAQAGGETTVTATAVLNPELSASASVTVDLAPVDLLIEPPETLLTSIGESAVLEPVGLDVQGAPIFGLGGVWTSSDPAIVAVDDDGVVTGLAPGEAVITVEVDGLIAEALVIVDPVPASITIEPLEAVLTALDQSVQFMSVVLDAGGTEIPDAPRVWTSESQLVATVDDLGVVTATGAGETLITVSSGAASASAHLQVQLPVTSVEVNPPDATIFVTGDVLLTATAFDALGNPIPGITFDWTSSDPGVLIVFGSGLALGATPGVATATATSPDGVSGTATVTVQAGSGTPTSMRFLLQPPSSVTQGEQFTVTVEIVDESGARATGYNDLVELTLQGGGGSGSLSGSTLEQASSGLATFPGLSVNQIGTDYTIFADGHTSSVGGGANSTLFDVTASGGGGPLLDSNYLTAGNTELIVGNFPGPPTAHVHDFTNPLGSSGATVTQTGLITTTNDGTVDMQANGGFSYTPPSAGFNGQDSFTLTTDMGTATVFIDFLGMVWYVDGTSPGSFPDGTSVEPFPTIGAATGVAGPGDIIYVLQSTYTEIVNVQAGQELIGSTGSPIFVQPGGSGPVVQVDCDLCGESFGSRPLVDPSNFLAMSLAADVEVVGFDLVGGVRATGATTLTTVTDLSVTGGGEVTVSNGTGTFVFNNVDVTQSQGFGVLVDDGAPNVRFDGTVSNCQQFNILSVQNTTGGTVQFTGGPYTADNSCLGAQIANSASDVTIDNLQVLPGGNGISVFNGGTGTYTFNNYTYNSTAGQPIGVSGDSPTVIVNLGGGGIVGGNGFLNFIDVNNTAGGSVTISGASITETNGRGIEILNTGGPVTINSPVTITNPNLDALRFDNADDATFSSFSATTNFDRGIFAPGGPGTLTIQNGILDTTDDDAIFVQNTTVDLTFSSVTLDTCQEQIFIDQAPGSSTTIGLMDLFNCDGTPLFLDNAGTFTVTNPASTVTADFAAAVDITSTNLNVTLGTLGVTGFATDGVRIFSSTGTFTATGGSITDTNANGIELDGNNMTFTYGGSITNTSGNSVNLQGNTGGTFTFNGPINDTGTGIFLDNNIGATINFGGGLDITTDGTAGFTATGGGTVNVTGAGNVLNAQNAPSIDILNTTIGASGITFESISNSGPNGSSAMRVQNTGAGSFTVTGDGSTPGSGGLMTLGGFGGDLTFSTVQTVDLRFMTVTGSEFDGLSLANVPNASVQSSSFTSMGQGSGGDAIAVNAPTGNYTFDNVTAQSASQTGIRVSAAAGSPLINITNSTINGNSGDGINLTSTGTAQVLANVRGSSMSNNFRGVVGASTGASSQLDLTIGGPNPGDQNTINSNSQHGVELSRNSTGSILFDVDNNTLNNPLASAGVQANFAGPVGGTLAGFIRNNTIDGGSDGIFAVTDNAVTTLQVSNNTITNVTNTGLFARTGTNPGDAGDLAITVLGNAIEVEYYGEGIGISAEESGVVCANVGGTTAPVQNTFTDVGGGFAAIGARQFSVALFLMERLVGTPATAGPVEAQLLTDNPNDAGIGMFSIVSTSFTGVPDGTCRVPT